MVSFDLKITWVVVVDTSNFLFQIVTRLIFQLSLLGDAVLHKLVLKQSALDDLNLPVKTVAGHIGICIIDKRFVLGFKKNLFYR